MKLSNLLVASTVIMGTYAGSPSIWFTSDKNFDGKIVKQLQKWNVAGDKVEGYYYGTQFFFSGTNEVGYYGPQPRKEGTTNHLTFSVFGYGPYSDHPNCYKSADGGPGVSCAVDFPWEYGKNYTTEVTRTAQNDDGSNRWTGTLVDGETGEKLVTIGEYWTPKNYSLLQTGGNTFDELYAIDHYRDSCMPVSSYVGFYPVQSQEDGTSFTPTLDAWDNLDLRVDACARAANESNQQGWNIPGGFVYVNGLLNLNYEGKI
ncbi:uncharacterized protein CANTADRAFT_20839 [Suhomyces tanzawaensis NRRL Y-17324]|uniref:Uncharacterized protein n=1 Tax=Suhomyces tanzawaensis NRRL Y-17324 TaxID=984487 RepID=A0A1E4SJB8_9ASCO|nr:uncharacterized protein CANTADRAFT_20839 [Suhomyces tanzawaensis NRRL Y-17324]ODV79532.1 hypothetical protein CANTADRAFT_20839 [Suhomyces tanzawaensis NRRL Y-17324]